jgi:hypothetical protein
LPATPLLQVYNGVSPGVGTDPGILQTGRISLSSLTAQINGSTPGTEHDQLQVTGTLQVGGNLNVSLGYTPAVGEEIVLIDNDGSDAVSGTFSTLQGNLLAVDGYLFAVDYAGGDGNDVSLTRVAAAAWDGGGADNLWSTVENWVDDQLPQSGDIVLFPSDADQLSNENDLPAGTAYPRLIFTGSGYEVSGNSLVISESIVFAGYSNSLATPLQLTADLSVLGTGSSNFFGGDIDLNGNNLTLSSYSLQVDGKISGNGNLVSSSYTILAAANSYNGTTTINGQLRLDHPQGLGSADGTAGTGTTLNGTLYLQDVGVIADELLAVGSGTIYLTGTNVWDAEITGSYLYLNGYGTLQVDDNLTLSNHVYFNDYDVKLILNGSSNSATRIYHNYSSYGRLEVNGALNLTATSTTSLVGVLSGSGSISYPANSQLNVNRQVNPGVGEIPAILQTGSISLVGLIPQLNGVTAGSQHDQLQVTGTVQVNGALQVELRHRPVVGSKFVLIANDGVDPVAGTFTSLPQLSEFTAASNVFRINYQGGDGNDVEIEALTDFPPPPTFTSSASVYLDENFSTSEPVITVTATDPDIPAQTITFTLSGADAR